MILVPIKLFILLLPLILIVLALVFGGRTARWIVGGFLCLLLVGVLFLLGVRQSAEVRVASVDMPGLHVAHDLQSGSDTIDMPGLHVADDPPSGSHTVDMPGLYVTHGRSSSRSQDRIVVEPPVPIITVKTPPTPYVYQPGDSYIDPNERHADRAETDQLDPNIYPSVETAALQCARKVITRFSEKFMAENEKRAIQVDARQLPIAAPLILATLEKEFGWLRFTVLENPTTHPESDANHSLILKLSASDPDKPRRKKSVQTTVSARLDGPGVQLEWRRTAPNKGWVENLTDWKSREGISSPLIVIDPPFLSASSAESKNRAIQLASQKVAEYVRAHPILQNGAIGNLDGFVQGELRRGKLVRDEFLQRFERPYGVVYRDALLLDVSDEQVAVLAQQYGAISAVQSQHLNRNVASAVGLVLLIVVVNLFLNAATKGYYVWSLRMGSFVLIAAGIYTVVRLT